MSANSFTEDGKDILTMKINCVILNYNDAETVEKLVRQIEKYSVLDGIVLVDNASTDDSWQRLQTLKGEKISVIRAEKNGGYGAGNNWGIRYAVEVNQATHVVIANPDVSFSENCIRGLARLFQRHPKVGVAAAGIEDKNYKPFQNSWKSQGFVGQLLYMGPVSRRVWARFLYYPGSYFKGKKAVWVDEVHGSMLMVDATAFLECGGYDEGIFLYQEEMVLARRMREAGKRTVLLLTESYYHEHSTTIGKSYQKELERQKLREQSVLYYMEKYLHINCLQEWIARLWFGGIRMEVRVFRCVERLWKRIR
ncbi:MAG: glycosyltransferase family 2 protein [Lachnospiraceae bacterium]|nr:glycosyltransferase family 2 protein [Lachnospiraceae bacterium]